MAFFITRSVVPWILGWMKVINNPMYTSRRILFHLIIDYRSTGFFVVFFFPSIVKTRTIVLHNLYKSVFPLIWYCHFYFSKELESNNKTISALNLEISAQFTLLVSTQFLQGLACLDFKRDEFIRRKIKQILLSYFRLFNQVRAITRLELLSFVDRFTTATESNWIRILYKEMLLLFSVYLDVTNVLSVG